MVHEFMGIDSDISRGKLSVKNLSSNFIEIAGSGVLDRKQPHVG